MTKRKLVYFIYAIFRGVDVWKVLLYIDFVIPIKSLYRLQLSLGRSVQFFRITANERGLIRINVIIVKLRTFNDFPNAVIFHGNEESLAVMVCFAKSCVSIDATECEMYLVDFRDSLSTIGIQR